MEETTKEKEGKQAQKDKWIEKKELLNFQVTGHIILVMARVWLAFVCRGHPHVCSGVILESNKLLSAPLPVEEVITCGESNHDTRVA